MALVEAYCKAQGLWREAGMRPVFTDMLELDLSTVEPSLAGPKRPQDRVALTQVKSGFAAGLSDIVKGADLKRRVKVDGADYDLGNGDVVIAAITSCTNTSNPSVLIAAGLLARNAHKKGLKSKPWVKTSLAPGSQVVTDYLAKAEPDRTTSTRWASTWPATAAPPASAIPGRCPTISPTPSARATWWSARCCRAIATSRAASTPT